LYYRERLTVPESYFATVIEIDFPEEDAIIFVP
jgi:hypothetical protein